MSYSVFLKRVQNLELAQKSSHVHQLGSIDACPLGAGAMKRLRSPEKTTPNPGRPGGRFSLRGWTFGAVIPRMYVSFCNVLLEILESLFIQKGPNYIILYLIFAYSYICIS